MSERSVRGLDVLEELRLRRWAREHFVATDERDAAWHPIVLEEMEQKDRELADAELLHPRRSAAGLVPLVPNAGRFYIIDDGHSMGADRRVLLSVETVE
jgi:hypothetical protein